MERSNTKIVLALMVCALLFFTGPAKPMVVSASDDVEIEEIDDGGDYGDDDTYDDTYDDSEDIDPAEDDGGDDTTAEETDDVEDEVTSSSYNTANTPDTSKLEAEIASLSTEIDRLKAETKQLESNIANARTEREKAMAEKSQLDRQLSLTQSELAALNQRIELLEENILAKQASIVEKQQEIDYNYELLKKRVRSQYMADDGSMLGLLLTADSFSDFLTHTEYMVRITQHDRDLMAHLTDERIAIEEEKADMEESKQQVEADKADTVVIQDDLAKKYSAAALQVQNLNDMEAQYNADLEKNKAMRDQMESEIKDIYRKIELSKAAYVGGEMAWPLPGFSTISSNFGSRFGGSDYHTGMDITGTGCYGAQIVAANDGTVKFVNTAYTDGWGYGIYLIVDHGGNISTLYAHCSSILVSVGQEVKRGEPIALVGSTGWSTGPHVHFEVRIGSTPQNPHPYVTGG